MTTHTIDLLIGITWALHAFVFGLLGWELVKTARNYSGPLRWPIPGRWLIALYFLSYPIMVLDVTRLRIEWSWLDHYWSDNPTTVYVLAIRLLPLAPGVWMAWRVRTTGKLLNRDEDTQHTNGVVA